MSNFLTETEISDIINYAKSEATGLASVCYITGYFRREALDFLKNNMSPSEFLAWFYNVNERSTVKMPISKSRVEA